MIGEPAGHDLGVAAEGVAAGVGERTISRAVAEPLTERALAEEPHAVPLTVEFVIYPHARSVARRGC